MRVYGGRKAIIVTNFANSSEIVVLLQQTADAMVSWIEVEYIQSTPFQTMQCYD